MIGTKPACGVFDLWHNPTWPLQNTLHMLGGVIWKSDWFMVKKRTNYWLLFMVEIQVYKRRKWKDTKMQKYKRRKRQKEENDEIQKYKSTKGGCIQLWPPSLLDWPLTPIQDWSDQFYKTPHFFFSRLFPFILSCLLDMMTRRSVPSHLVHIVSNKFQGLRPCAKRTDLRRDSPWTDF